MDRGPSVAVVVRMRGWTSARATPARLPHRPRGRIMAAFGDRRASEVTTGDVNRFLRELDRPGLSARTTR